MMEYTKLNVTKMKKGEAADRYTPVSLFGNYAIEVEGDGNGIVIDVQNENLSEAKIIVVAADNVFCGGDRSLKFKAVNNSSIHLEGSPYVQTSGEYKGMILIEGQEGTDDAKISVMEIL